MFEKSWKLGKCWVVGILFAWFDVWVGFYYNTSKRRLYCMVPFFGFYIERKRMVESPEYIVEAVRRWQRDESLHPLTCAEHSEVPLLAQIQGKGVVLVCRYCDYKQEHIPDVVLEHGRKE